MTVYKYYAYPANTRPRISQMLVLPPFQRLGLGANLLDMAQRFFWKEDKVVDITGKRKLINDHFPINSDSFSNLELLTNYVRVMMSFAMYSTKYVRNKYLFSRQIYSIHN